MNYQNCNAYYEVDHFLEAKDMHKDIQGRWFINSSSTFFRDGLHRLDVTIYGDRMYHEIEIVEYKVKTHNLCEFGCTQGEYPYEKGVFKHYLIFEEPKDARIFVADWLNNGSVFQQTLRAWQVDYSS